MDIFQQLVLDPLQFGFMQRALLAVLLLGIVSGVMGAYVVTRGLAFLGDAMAHSVLPGVAVAYLLGGTGGSLLAGGMVAGLISALGIGFLTRGKRIQEDTAIGIIFAGMLALGIGIISSSRTFATDLQHILIGNILAVSDIDLVLIVLIGIVVLALVWALYKELLVISFDPALAQTLHLPGEALHLLLLVLLAMTIVAGTQAVGVAMVTATLVTPAAAARLFAKRLHHLMLLAALIASTCGVVGMYISWHLGVVLNANIAPSAAIVLLMTTVFIAAFLFAPGKGYVWSLTGRSAKKA